VEERGLGITTSTNVLHVGSSDTGFIIQFVINDEVMLPSVRQVMMMD
jgi:hypothetical protein